MMTIMLSSILFLLALIMVNPSPPLIMLILLLICIILCFLSSWALSSPWFSFILFIIFVGALMVLFAYISSLAANEKMEITLTPLSLTMLIFTSGATLALIAYKSNKIPPISNNSMILDKIYTTPMWGLVITTMSFLLITMFVAASLALPSKAPLRAYLQLK